MRYSTWESQLNTIDMNYREMLAKQYEAKLELQRIEEQLADAKAALLNHIKQEPEIIE